MYGCVCLPCVITIQRVVLLLCFFIIDDVYNVLVCDDELSCLCGLTSSLFTFFNRLIFIDFLYSMWMNFTHDVFLMCLTSMNDVYDTFRLNEEKNANKLKCERYNWCAQWSTLSILKTFLTAGLLITLTASIGRWNICEHFRILFKWHTYLNNTNPITFSECVWVARSFSLNCYSFIFNIFALVLSSCGGTFLN